MPSLGSPTGAQGKNDGFKDAQFLEKAPISSHPGLSLPNKEKRIVLIKPPIYNCATFAPIRSAQPLGIWQLGSFLQAKGYEVRIIDTVMEGWENKTYIETGKPFDYRAHLSQRVSDLHSMPSEQFLKKYPVSDSEGRISRTIVRTGLSDDSIVERVRDFDPGVIRHSQNYVFSGRGIHRFKGLPGVYSYSNNPDLYDLVEDIPGERALYDGAVAAIKRICQGKKDVVLIDFCCGTMAIEQRLDSALPIKKMLGVDACEEYLVKTREVFKDDGRVVLVVGDAINTKLPAKADIIIASSAYHHIGDLDFNEERDHKPYDREKEYERKMKFLGNVADHLQEDGQVIFCENFIGPYKNEEEYSRRVRQFYKKRIWELIEGMGIEDERVELLREVMEFGVDRTYEWKVSLDMFKEHLEQAGLRIEKIERVWPPNNLNVWFFKDEEIGDYVIVAKKVNNNTSKTHDQEPAKNIAE